MKHLKTLIAFSFLSVISALLVWSCTKDKTPRPGATTITEPCDPTKIYFQTQVMPIFNANCAMSGCHDAATRQDGVNLSSYDGIRNEVRPGNPGDSDIMEMITEDEEDERMPPAPRPRLSAEQISIISKWIQQGADNLQCTVDSAGCNPVNVSFASSIQPVLNSNCIGCHSGSTLSGGVNLSTYSGVQAVAQSGKLVNAVSHNGQATPMPPNGKLPACDIEKIKSWVQEGIKNN
jgi:mono/diheme cytochrome c family protein